LRPVGHDGGQSSPLGFALMSDKATLAQIIFQSELEDGVVDNLGVLTEFYKFVNWSKSQFGLDEKI